MKDTLAGVKSAKDSQKGLLRAYSRAERLEDAGESNRQINIELTFYNGKLGTGQKPVVRKNTIGDRPHIYTGVEPSVNLFFFFGSNERVL